MKGRNRIIVLLLAGALLALAACSSALPVPSVPLGEEYPAEILPVAEGATVLAYAGEPGADGPGSFAVQAASADDMGNLVRYYADALKDATIAAEEQHNNTFLFRGTAGDYAFEITVSPATGVEGKGYKSFVTISAGPVPEQAAQAVVRRTAQPAVQPGQAGFLWQATAGGNNHEHPNCIRATPDGGAVMAGHTRSAAGSDGNVCDGYVAKFSADGQVEWENAYGGVSDDEIYSIECTADGGYVFAGASDSKEGQKDRTEGHPYFWVVKLTAGGGVEWSRNYGGTVAQTARCIRQTADGGYIVAGNAMSADGDVPENRGSADGWLLKLSADGAVAWSRTWGGTEWDEFRCVEITRYGYLVAGFTQSFGGDVGQTRGNSDMWVAKVSSDGELLWRETYGGGSRDEAQAVLDTGDGGFVVAGSTQSSEGDVEGRHEGESFGYRTDDYWVVRVTAEGKLLWSRCLGGSGMDSVAGIVGLGGGQLLVSGTTDSSDGDVTGWHEGHSAPQVPAEDVWAMCLSPNGEIVWETAYGGDKSEKAAGVLPLADGSILIGGAVDSSGDGVYDFWLARYAR